MPRIPKEFQWLASLWWLASSLPGWAFVNSQISTLASPRDSEAIPVRSWNDLLLIPDILDSPADWEKVLDGLQRAGFKENQLLPLWKEPGYSPRAGLTVQARLAARAIGARPRRPLAIIGHGTGGLVARACVAQLRVRTNPVPPVSLVIALGTPHQGRDWAKWVYRLKLPCPKQGVGSAAVRDLATDSDFLKKLNLPGRRRTILLEKAGEIINSIQPDALQSLIPQWPEMDHLDAGLVYYQTHLSALEKQVQDYSDLAETFHSLDGAPMQAKVLEHAQAEIRQALNTLKQGQDLLKNCQGWKLLSLQINGQLAQLNTFLEQSKVSGATSVQDLTVQLGQEKQLLENFKENLIQCLAMDPRGANPLFQPALSPLLATLGVGHPELKNWFEQIGFDKIITKLDNYNYQAKQLWPEVLKANNPDVNGPLKSIFGDWEQAGLKMQDSIKNPYFTKIFENTQFLEKFRQAAQYPTRLKQVLNEMAPSLEMVRSTQETINILNGINKNISKIDKTIGESPADFIQPLLPSHEQFLSKAQEFLTNSVGSVASDPSDMVHSLLEDFGNKITPGLAASVLAHTNLDLGIPFLNFSASNASWFRDSGDLAQSLVKSFEFQLPVQGSWLQAPNVWNQVTHLLQTPNWAQEFYQTKDGFMANLTQGIQIPIVWVGDRWKELTGQVESIWNTALGGPEAWLAQLNQVNYSDLSQWANRYLPPEYQAAKQAVEQACNGEYLSSLDSLSNYLGKDEQVIYSNFKRYSNEIWKYIQTARNVEQIIENASLENVIAQAGNFLGRFTPSMQGQAYVWGQGQVRSSHQSQYSSNGQGQSLGHPAPQAERYLDVTWSNGQNGIPGEYQNSSPPGDPVPKQDDEELRGHVSNPVECNVTPAAERPDFWQKVGMVLKEAAATWADPTRLTSKFEKINHFAGPWADTISHTLHRDILKTTDLAKRTSGQAVLGMKNMVKYAADNVLEFSGLGPDRFYDSMVYKKDIVGKRTGKAVPVGLVDMKLDYFNYFQSGQTRNWQAAADLETFGLAANMRWDRSIDLAAPKIAKLIDDKQCRVIMVPGVNDAGLTDEQLAGFVDQLDLKENQTLVIGHSAGTEGIARAMELSQRDKNEVYYLALSPRKCPQDYAEYLQNGNVDPTHVMTVNSIKDIPHWWDPTPDPVKFTNPLSQLSYEVNYRGRHDYDGARQTGTHVFIEGPKKPGVDLGHGSMVDGLYNQQNFDFVINGKVDDFNQKQNMEELINRFLNGETKRLGGSNE